ncbi:MAG: response regulator [Bacteroidetes bacterium]|nr:response regulator [Bacteroidota bacterium]
MKVLILEDNKFILSIIQAAIKEFNVEVQVATNVSEALSLYADFQPDLIMSDLHMESGTSVSFLEEVSKSKSHHVLVVSSDFELLSEVEEKLGGEKWRYVNKNNRRWLMQVKKELKSSIVLQGEMY